MATATQIQISKADFRRDIIMDESPDLSFLGEYSNKPETVHIDRNARGDMERNQFRYFNLGTGDADYIEQDYKRMEAYNAGDWHMVCVRASVEIKLPIGGGKYKVTQTIHMPGLWGVESDARESYLEEIFKEESAMLVEMLEAMSGIEVID